MTWSQMDRNEKEVSITQFLAGLSLVIGSTVIFRYFALQLQSGQQAAWFLLMAGLCCVIIGYLLTRMELENWTTDFERDTRASYEDYQRGQL